jgi:hypothetical protein
MSKYIDEASHIDPKDLEGIKLPKQVKGKIEYHSTPEPIDLEKRDCGCFFKVSSKTRTLYQCRPHAEGTHPEPILWPPCEEIAKPIESLDEILTNLGAYKITSFEPTVEEYYAYYPELKRAKQALEAYITERELAMVTPTHIMGKPIDEVCGILAMLDMERLAEMQLTMANLHKWYKLLAEEQKNMIEKTLADRLTSLSTQEEQV